MRKLPPDRRPDLRDLLGRAEPVEPRHQRRVQAGGDRERRGRDRAGGPPRVALALRLQYRLLRAALVKMVKESLPYSTPLWRVLTEHSLQAACDIDRGRGLSISRAELRSAQKPYLHKLGGRRLCSP